MSGKNRNEEYYIQNITNQLIRLDIEYCYAIIGETIDSEGNVHFWGLRRVSKDADSEAEWFNLEVWDLDDEDWCRCILEKHRAKELLTSTNKRRYRCSKNRIIFIKNLQFGKLPKRAIKLE